MLFTKAQPYAILKRSGREIPLCSGESMMSKPFAISHVYRNGQLLLVPLCELVGEDIGENISVALDCELVGVLKGRS